MSSSANASALLSTETSFMRLPPVRVTLVLSLRQADDEAVERLRHLDLARQPGVRPVERGKAQHTRLLRARHRRPGHREPCLIDIDVAGGAGAFAAAIGVDAGNVVIDSAAHDRLAERQLDLVGATAALDIGDFGHVPDTFGDGTP